MNKLRKLSSTILTVWVLAGLGTLPLVAADFDSDGYADLAVGTPHENVGSSVSQMQAGAVSTIYGSSSGLTTTGNQYWTENLNLDGVSEGSDHLGATLAAGDFDNDGYIDLVIGVPDEDVGSVTNAGKVNVVYGTASGLAEAGNQSWHEDSDGMDSSSEEWDYFGSSLAVGDFNGDGYDDLAVGVPQEDVSSTVDAGAVHVIFGSPTGLSATWVADEWLTQGELDGSTEAGNQFGFSVAAGDFDNDGYDDLAVGAPRNDLPDNPEDIVDAGTVNIAWGASIPFVDRLTNDLWHQDRTGVPDYPEAYDQFGYSLIAGDFDNDGYDDLAIGVPFEDCGTVVKSNAGAVHVLFGSSTGVSGTSSHYFHQDSTSGGGNVGGTTEADDRFGEVLGAGDFDGDGFSDLVVGVPYESVSTWEDSGLVQVFFGGSGGLEVPDQFITAGALATDGSNGTDHNFGYAVAAGDFDGDGDDDLAIGAPGHIVGVNLKAGMVFVLPGVSGGLSLTNQTFTQGGGGMIGTNEENDRFGKALVAIPRGNDIFSDGFESGGTTRWSLTVD